MNPKLSVATGWLLIASILLSLYTNIDPDFAGYWAGIPIWICAILFFPHLKASQKKQVSIVGSFGIAALVFSVWHGIDSKYLLQALEGNQKVIAMLISVGFLKVVLRQTVKSGQKFPTGGKAISSTMLSTHLFGSVLNVSSVIIVGDKLLANQPDNRSLSPLQNLLLLRAFATCSAWSPFFAAMGLTLISVPGTQLGVLVFYGLIVAIIALLFTAWEISRSPEAASMQGYPMAVHSLWIPSLLAIIVLIAHYTVPNLSVLTIVTITSLLFSTLWLMVTLGPKGIQATKQHIKYGIPESKSEVALFVCAALLASGIAALLVSLDLNVVPEHFGPFAASVTILVIIALAMAGMHPVTSIILIGSILAPTVSDPNLLGLALLMGCSIGIALSPFSGVQLTIQNRYDISPITLLKMNKHYAIVMYPVCCLTLWVYSIQVGLH
jgi:hypothetical protein